MPAPGKVKPAPAIGGAAIDPPTPPNEKTGVSYAKAAVKPPLGSTPVAGETYADAVKDSSEETVDADTPASSKLPRRVGSKKEPHHDDHDDDDDDDVSDNEELLQKQERMNRRARQRDEEMRKKAGETGEEVEYAKDAKARKKHEKEERKKQEKHEREERLKLERQEKEEQERQEKEKKQKEKHEREERKRLEKEEKHIHDEKKRHEDNEKHEHELKAKAEQHEHGVKEKLNKGDGTRSPIKTGEQVHSEEENSEKPAQDRDSENSLVSALPRVRWAPLRGIPMHRRLEMAAVLWHAMAMGLFLSFFWFLLAIPFTWPILVPYLIYILFSTAHMNGSAPYKWRSNFMRSLPLWRFYADYFPIRLHRTVELPTDKNYIFAYHPHGIISHGAFANFATDATGFSELFPGITNTLLTLDTNFRVPFYREYLLSLGLSSVSRRSCEALLRGDAEPARHSRELTKPSTWIMPPARDQRKDQGAGRAITIVIGGARESLEALPGKMRLVVKRRRGFLKIALKEGAGVVPVLAFGENDLYDQVIPEERSWVHRAQMGIKKTLGFTLPLFHARGIFNYDVGLMPYRREVNVVVGRPIFPKERVEDPRDPEVNELQERYVQELMRMWDQHKDQFARNRVQGEEGEMVFVE